MKYGIEQKQGKLYCANCGQLASNSDELEKNRTAEDFSIVQKEGNRSVKRSVEFYNLDAIIAVGYRVNSKKATKFRQWATKTLREYITKGFVINEKMLKNGKPFGKDYFDELLEKIREIRASNRSNQSICLSPQVSLRGEPDFQKVRCVSLSLFRQLRAALLRGNSGY